MLYDIVILIIIAIFIIVGARRGAAKTLLSAVALLLSVVLSVFASKFLAELIFDGFIRGYIEGIITTVVEGTGIGDTVAAASEVVSALPGVFISVLSFFGMGIEALEGVCADAFATEGADATQTILSTIEPAITGLITVIIGIILFIILFFISQKIASVMAKAFELPLVRVANYLAGGILGMLQGVLVVTIIIFIFKLLLPIFSNEWTFLSQEYMEGSYIFSLIYSGKLLSTLQEFIYGISQLINVN